jgi:hypothetical protein
MFKKTLIIIIVLALIGTWCWAEAPKPSPTPTPLHTVAPLPGKAPPPNLMPLMDTLYGLLALEKSATPLNNEQVKKVYAALQEANELFKAVEQKDSIVKQILTPQQVKYIEEVKKAGKLNFSLPPVKPGENPVTAKAMSILEKKAKGK